MDSLQKGDFYYFARCHWYVLLRPRRGWPGTTPDHLTHNHKVVPLYCAGAWGRPRRGWRERTPNHLLPHTTLNRCCYVSPRRGWPGTPGHHSHNTYSVTCSVPRRGRTGTTPVRLTHNHKVDRDVMYASPEGDGGANPCHLLPHTTLNSRCHVSPRRGWPGTPATAHTQH